MAVLMRAEAACPSRITYTANLNLSTKVLDFVQFVGPFFHRPVAGYDEAGEPVWADSSLA